MYVVKNRDFKNTLWNASVERSQTASESAFLFFSRSLLLCIIMLAVHELQSRCILFPICQKTSLLLRAEPTCMLFPMGRRHELTHLACVRELELDS